MAKHQHKPNANELWLYFQSVIAWVKATFPKYRKEMKGVPWGELYNEFKDAELDSAKLEEQVASLMADEDVTKKKGIYSYVLDGQEKHLNIRAFSRTRSARPTSGRRASAPVKVAPRHFDGSSNDGDGSRPHHPVARGRED